MVFVILVFLFATDSYALEKLSKIQVLASVSGAVVTDRAVAVEEVLENPAAFKEKLKEGSDISEGLQLGQSTQRLVFQFMVEEENRIFQSEKVSSAEVEEAYGKVKSSLTAEGFAKFLKYYDLTEREIKKKIERRILLQKSLISRMKYHASSGQIEEQSKVLEEWYQQLKGRYKVVFFGNH